MIADLQQYFPSVLTGTFTLLGVALGGTFSFLISRHQSKVRERESQKKLDILNCENILVNLQDSRDAIHRLAAKRSADLRPLLHARIRIKAYLPEISGEFDKTLREIYNNITAYVEYKADGVWGVDSGDGTIARYHDSFGEDVEFLYSVENSVICKLDEIASKKC